MSIVDKMGVWIKEAAVGSLDAPETTIHHSHLIRRKTLLNRVYRKWYGDFAAVRKTLPPGRVVELGSGGGFLTDFCAEAVTSDVMPLPGVQMCFSAEAVPFEDASVSAYFLLNVFHHIPEVSAFLSEAERTLVP